MLSRERSTLCWIIYCKHCIISTPACNLSRRSGSTFSRISLSWGLDETLSVKGISVKFRKCKRRENKCYVLVTIADRYLRRPHLFLNCQLGLVAVALCENLKFHCSYCIKIYETPIVAVASWNFSNYCVPNNIVLKCVV